jgi:hypothetical protein
MGKPIFFTANVRDITDQWLKEEITYGRMVELLNEIVEPHIVIAFEMGKELTVKKGEDYYNSIYKSWKG